MTVIRRSCLADVDQIADQVREYLVTSSQGQTGGQYATGL